MILKQSNYSRSVFERALVGDINYFEVYFKSGKDPHLRYVPSEENLTGALIAHGNLLHAASISKCSALIKLLLDNGVSYEDVNADREPAAVYIVENITPSIAHLLMRRTKIIKFLADYKEPIAGGNLIHKTITKNNMRSFHFALDICSIEATDQFGLTPLLLACELNKPVTLTVIDCLSERSVNAATSSSSFFEQSILAIFMVDELLSIRADSSKVSSQNGGKNVFHYAAMNNWNRIFRHVYASELLNVADELNADTPLTIAAQNNNFALVILLLKKGSNPCIMNSRGFSLINALATGSLQINNTTLKEDIYALLNECYFSKISLLPPASVKFDRVICSDISGGREARPIICINNIDDCPAPISTFKYCPVNIIDEVDEVLKMKSLKSCTCILRTPNTIFKIEDNVGCDKHACLECSCSKPMCWYDENGLIRNIGRIHKGDDKDELLTIYECGRNCKCVKYRCLNRVVADGSKCTLILFKTSCKGWGVKTAFNVEKGQFVCEYVGEYLTSEQSIKRNCDTYLFTLSTKTNRFLIDAQRYGNISRFINHSCDPNMTTVKVYSDSWNKNLPRLAFFALTNIAAGEEITIDYSDDYWRLKKKKHHACA